MLPIAFTLAHQATRHALAGAGPAAAGSRRRTPR